MPLLSLTSSFTLLSAIVACPVDRIAVGDVLCMPFASDGDVMKHTPAINDTTTVRMRILTLLFIAQKYTHTRVHIRSALPILYSTPLLLFRIDIIISLSLSLSLSRALSLSLHPPALPSKTARWLAAGGRGVDTAWSYDHGGYGHSQRQDGVAIQASGVARSELWVTTKIPCGTSTAAVLDLVQYDLDQLMLDTVDLLLIHSPTSPNCTAPAGIASTWIGMQAAVKAGKAKSIGVSNFKPSQLDALAKAPGVSVVPAVNQILLHVGTVDKETVQYCAKAGIVVEAYSPLGHPNGGGKAVYDIPQVVAIGKAHNVSGAQVGLRWLVQNKHPFVTASGESGYDYQDLALFNWTLTEAEMRILNNLKQP